MATQYQIPGGPYVNAKEEGLEYQLPGNGYLNETLIATPAGGRIWTLASIGGLAGNRRGIAG